MLQVIQQYKRSQNIILLGIVAILAAGMIIAYTPAKSFFGSGGPTKAEPVPDDAVIAEIDGRPVLAKDYKTALDRFLAIYRQYAQQSPGSQLPTTIRDLRERGTDKEILRSLIRDKVIEIEAERLGLLATDEEVRNRIREQYSQDGKWIGYEKFKRALERQGTDVLTFEAQIRKSITEEKLKNFVASGVTVSQREVEQDFKDTNTKYDLSFVEIADVNFKDKVAAPTDAEGRAFFDSHKDLFRATKEQRKVRYLYVSQDKAAETIPVTDEELRKEFDPDKQIKSAHIRQIVLNVLTEKDDATVKAKADDLVRRARGNGSVKPEDFATLAQGNSQDAATSGKGGDLGTLERSAVKSGDPREKAFDLKPGDISEPIKSGNSYYIFKVDERTPKTFEEAKAGLLASVRNRLSYKRASEIADKAERLLAQTRNAQKVAEDIAKDLNQQPSEVLRETPFFAPGDEVPEIGSNPSFEETTSILTKPDEVGAKVGIRGGFGIPQLVAVRKPTDPVYEEVKEKVSERVKKDKMLQMAYDQARQLIAESQNTAGLKAAAEKLGLKAEEVKDVARDTPLGGKVYAAFAAEAAKSTPGGLIATPLYSTFDAQFISVGVVGIVSRKDPDLSKLKDESKGIQDRLRTTRVDTMFDAYLDAFKQRMKDTGRYKLYSDMIERILVTASDSDLATAR